MGVDASGPAVTGHRPKHDPPRIHPQGGCGSTHAAAMLCLSGRRDAQKCTPDEVEKAMALHYQIKVTGVLDEDWSDWFDGLTITHDATGDTILEGAVRDQTALYGLIAKARDLGLSLIAVEQRTTAMNTDPAAPLGRTTDLSQ